MNQDQRKAIAAIQLTEETISEVERNTGWHYDQHTRGTDIRFTIANNNRGWRHGGGLVIWLHYTPGSEITIGFWVNNGKAKVQEVFRNILGNWAPKGMAASGYNDPGRNPDQGHVGDWGTGIPNNAFGANIDKIRQMVNEIVQKMADTGLDNFLHYGTEPHRPDGGVLGGVNIDVHNVAEIKEGKMNDDKNIIVFGAPGTGKSHELGKRVSQKFVDIDGDNRHERFERVTFYPTYSYAQFVGTYKPVMKPKVNGAAGEEEIAYEFVPGPFLRVLVKALNDHDHEYCLVIEEINRTNAAAVFGDVFQLLDRESDGVSEYQLAASEDVKKYLQKELWGSQYAMEFLKVDKKKNTQGMETAEWESCSLRIPPNMYIWATMNSADQGVFPMDTAFKRRWAFEYIGIDDRVTDECRRWTTEVKGYNWNDLRRFINGLLSAYDVNEDKMMGPYFVKADNGDVISKNLFNSKVLMYLWEDAARMIRRNLFDDIKTYSALIEKWGTDGVKVFDHATKKDALSNELRNFYGQWTAPAPTAQENQAQAATLPPGEGQGNDAHENPADDKE